MAAYANDATQLPTGFDPTTAVQINGAETITAGYSYYSVPWGFAATNGTINIVVLRGTVSGNYNEVVADIYSWGTNSPCVFPPSQTQYGEVNASLLTLYTQSDSTVTSLSSSLTAAVATLDPSLPLYIAAHSLGGPMVTFGLLDILSNVPYQGAIQLYTFASLHVGIQSFADAFNAQGIVTYRFANLCDFVPSLTGISDDTPSYIHVGLPCTFVWQTWEDWGNHSMANIYLPTIQKSWSVIQTGDLNYPASVTQ